MRHVFILNPAAGKGRGFSRRLGAIKEFASKEKLNFEIVVTEGPGWATEYVQRTCLRGGALRFYACGGDGTLREVVCGIVGFPRAEVAYYPCGTGNDFMRNFTDEDSFRNIKSLVEGVARPIDLLQVNDQYCVNICNLGFDADVADHVKNFKKLPFMPGIIAYTISVFACLFNKMMYQMSIANKKEIIAGTYILAVFANGRSYGGGFLGAPRAKIDDGLIDMILVSSLSRMRIISLLQSYQKGRHLEDRRLKDVIFYSQSSERISVSTGEPIPVSLDGDIFHWSRIVIDLLPGKIFFVIPSSSEEQS